MDLARDEKWKFVKRDLLQAMIADKILVVDCDAKSGTMHAVREGVREKKISPVL